MIDLILLIVGLICFGAATIGLNARVNLVALGLLAVYLRELVP